MKYTKKFIREEFGDYVFDKENSEELLKELNKNSRKYDKVMSKIIKLNVDKEKEKFKVLHKKEEELNKRNIWIRKKLGIFVYDPCRIRKCKPFILNGCRFMNKDGFCRQYDMYPVGNKYNKLLEDKGVVDRIRKKMGI